MTLEDNIQGDDHVIPEVGSWGKSKYSLITHYASMFATSMKNRWDSRVYLDLFAGAGLARIKETGRIVKASPLLALSARDKFDQYIFCEYDEEKLHALQIRVETWFPGSDVHYIPGDVNRSTDRIMATMPEPSRQCTVLTLCFVDPFKMENLRFSTLRALSARYVDILILIPTYMDANLRELKYIEPDNDVVENYLGLPDWRDEWNRWKEEKGPKPYFGTFVLEFFGRQMKHLGYIKLNLEETETVRAPDNRRPLYHLAFFSKHELGVHFWRKALKHGLNQGDLFRPQA